MKYVKRLIINAFRNRDEDKLTEIIEYEHLLKERGNKTHVMVCLIGLMYCLRHKEKPSLSFVKIIASRFNALRISMSLPYPQAETSVAALEKELRIDTSFGVIIRDFFQNKVPMVENKLLFNFEANIIKKVEVHGMLPVDVMKRQRFILKKYEEFAGEWNNIVLSGSLEDNFTIFHINGIQGIMKNLYKEHIYKLREYGVWNKQERAFLDSLSLEIALLKASQQNVFFQNFSACMLAWSYCADYLALRIVNKQIQKRLKAMPSATLFEALEHWTEKVTPAIQTMIASKNVTRDGINETVRSFFKIYIYKK